MEARKYRRKEVSFQDKFYKDQRYKGGKLEQTGEGIFEVSNDETKRSKKKTGEGENVQIRTLAQQKVDRELKKISKKAKVSAWNPNGWQTDDAIDGRRRQKGRWDDINVPNWKPSSDKKVNSSVDSSRFQIKTNPYPGLPSLDSRSTSSSGSSTANSRSHSARRARFPESSSQPHSMFPVILPNEQGARILRKSASSQEVFFSTGLVANSGLVSTSGLESLASLQDFTINNVSSSHQHSNTRKSLKKRTRDDNNKEANDVSTDPNCKSGITSQVQITNQEEVCQKTLILNEEENNSEKYSEGELGRDKQPKDNQTMDELSSNQLDNQCREPDLSDACVNDKGDINLESDLSRDQERNSQPDKTDACLNDKQDMNVESDLSTEQESKSQPEQQSSVESEELEDEHRKILEISRDSFNLFSDLKTWKLVHYNRLASWIKVRTEEELRDVGWHCVVGEIGGFEFCLSPQKLYKISLDPVIVLLFKTKE